MPKQGLYEVFIYYIVVMVKPSLHPTFGIDYDHTNIIMHDIPNLEKLKFQVSVAMAGP